MPISSTKRVTVAYSWIKRGSRIWLTADMPTGRMMRVFKYDPQIDHDLQIKQQLDKLAEDIIEKVKFEHKTFGRSELWLKRPKR